MTAAKPSAVTGAAAAIAERQVMVWVAVPSWFALLARGKSPVKSFPILALPVVAGEALHSNVLAA